MRAAQVMRLKQLRKTARIVAAIVAVPQAVVDLGSPIAGGSLLARLLREATRYRRKPS